ncbi:MAG TPA: hypothetical protein ENG33_08550 [Chloroflexi bacterium]|nr:hypothetical protein [Chloroflexota bacterium]
MGMKSRLWISQHRKELEDKYLGKVLIICGDKVVKVLEPDVGLLEINELGRRICKGKDWSYTLICREEECIL